MKIICLPEEEEEEEEMNLFSEELEGNSSFDAPFFLRFFLRGKVLFWIRGGIRSVVVAICQ